MNEDYYKAITHRAKHLLEMPVRQFPNPDAPRGVGTDRRCNTCKSSFTKQAPGITGLRGLWNEKGWYCSRQCWEAK